MRTGVRGDRVVKVLAGVAGLGIVLFLVDRPRRGAGRPIASHSATAPATQPLVLPVLGAAEPLGPDAAAAVERSIRGAVRFLYSVQTDAAWDVAGDDGETTALVLHALLSVGERADDPRLARAIERAAAAPVGNTKVLARDGPAAARGAAPAGVGVGGSVAGGDAAPGAAGGVLHPRTGGPQIFC